LPPTSNAKAQQQDRHPRLRYALDKALLAHFLQKHILL
jgi:hypothetical protein